VPLQATNPTLVAFELDIYWVVCAGQDPARLLQAHPGRFPCWHIKDMDKTNPDLNTQVGSSFTDYRPLMAYAGTAALQYPIMKQENFGLDAYQSIAQSTAYMRKRLFAPK